MKRVPVVVLYFATAIVTGYWSLRFFFLPVNGGPHSMWPVVMLSASILLLLGGIQVLLPQTRRLLLLLLAIVLPLVLCETLHQGLAANCWILAGVVTLATWITHTVAAATTKKSRAVFLVITTIVLAASWIPVLVDTVSRYFSAATASPDPKGVVIVLFPWILILGSLVVGICYLRCTPEVT